MQAGTITTSILAHFQKSWQSDLIESEVTEIGDLIRENTLLNETMLLQDTAMAVKDLRTMGYPCIFGDTEKVCGWSRKTLLEAGVGFYLSHIPAADLAGVETMNKLFSQYITKLTEEETWKFRAVYDYRMLRSDGKMCRILQESLVHRRDSSGKVASLLVLISNVTNMKREAFQHLRLTNGQENLVYRINNMTGTCQLLEGLSCREMEIGRLMGQHLTSEDIAQKLHLSLHTVNTHRYNMLRKFEMADTKELTNFLSMYRLF